MKHQVESEQSGAVSSALDFHHPHSTVDMHYCSACPQALVVLCAMSVKGLTHRFRLSQLTLSIDNGRELWRTQEGKLAGALPTALLFSRDERWWAIKDTSSVVNHILHKMNDFAKYPDRCSHELYAVKEVQKTVRIIRLRLLETINKAKTAQDAEQRTAAVKEAVAYLIETDRRLSEQPFMYGNRLTEADLWLFAILCRFDVVYAPLFGFDDYRLSDFANIQRLMYELAFKYDLIETIDLGQEYYRYYSSPITNPAQIMPCGNREWGWDFGRHVIANHRSYRMHEMLFS